MAKILVVAEQLNGRVKKTSHELLSAAKNSGATVEAILFGQGAKSLIANLASYGASKVYVCEASLVTNYNPEIYTSVVVDVIKQAQPQIVLATASSLGKDLMPRVGGRVGAGVASDCTALSLTGDNVSVRRPMYAGKVSAEVTFENSPIKIICMRPNSLPVNAPSSDASAQTVEVSAPTADLRTLVKEVARGTAGKVDLTEANIIVTGGRGIKGPENFKILEELASVLGAAVGASRAVVDAGWAPHEMQVGQTGKTVSPTLYIACGVSGAIQHLAGMSSSKVIVAINKDKDAPIFQKATYGIVGDLFEVVPLLTQEFKKLLQH